MAITIESIGMRGVEWCAESTHKNSNGEHHYDFYATVYGDGIGHVFLGHGHESVCISAESARILAVDLLRLADMSETKKRPAT